MMPLASNPIHLHVWLGWPVIARSSNSVRPCRGSWLSVCYGAFLLGSTEDLLSLSKADPATAFREARTRPRLITRLRTTPTNPRHPRQATTRPTMAAIPGARFAFDELLAAEDAIASARTTTRLSTTSNMCPEVSSTMHLRVTGASHCVPMNQTRNRG